MDKDKKFDVLHLFFGIAGLLVLEGVLLQYLSALDVSESTILLFSFIGAAMNMYVAIQAIEKVNRRLPMLVFLFLIILEFITFFAFEYWYLVLAQPASFPTVSADMLNLFLHSTMVFVLNPIHLPATPAGNILLLINTLSSFGIVIFILQNIWQLHHVRQREQL